MTIRCETCGRDSGVCEARLAAEVPDGPAYAILARDDWHLVVPRLGEPFRWFCHGCWPPAGEEAP
jgi:hypothetical protein